jgi:hypothetical protein
MYDIKGKFRRAGRAGSAFLPRISRIIIYFVFRSAILKFANCYNLFQLRGRKERRKYN